MSIEKGEFATLSCCKYEEQNGSLLRGSCDLSLVFARQWPTLTIYSTILQTHAAIWKIYGIQWRILTDLLDEKIFEIHSKTHDLFFYIRTRDVQVQDGLFVFHASSVNEYEFATPGVTVKSLFSAADCSSTLQLNTRDDRMSSFIPVVP